MTIRELHHKLSQRPFEPFDVVASSGERYPVRHPEMAQLTDRGTMYIFRPFRENPRVVTGPDVISLLHISALEPLENQSSAPETKRNDS